MTNGSCICGGGDIRLYIAHCPYCENIERFISQDSFEGYVVTSVCGGCGNAWQDEPLDEDDEDKQRNIEWVAREWGIEPRTLQKTLGDFT